MQRRCPGKPRTDRNHDLAVLHAIRRVGRLALPIAILSVALLPPAAYVYAWLTLLSPIANVIIMLIYSLVIGRVVEVVAARDKVRIHAGLAGPAVGLLWPHGIFNGQRGRPWRSMTTRLIR